LCILKRHFPEPFDMFRLNVTVNEDDVHKLSFCA
jgi:hypothetical protein